MSRRVRIGLVVLAALGGVYALLVGGLFAAMRQPPDEFGRVMARVPEPMFILLAVMPFESLWNIARGGDLEVGDPAPDFELEVVGEAASRVRLSSFRSHKPVVLVFGSFT